MTRNMNDWKVVGQIIIVIFCATFFKCGYGFIPNGCRGQINLVFLLDSSESIKESGGPNNDPLYGWKSIVNYTVQLVSNLPISTNYTTVATVRYATTAEVIFPLGSYSTVSAVQGALVGLNTSSGNTNIAAALSSVRNQVFQASNGFRNNIRNFVLIFTDGLDTVDTGDTLAQATQLKAAGVEIFAVGVGLEADANRLAAIASSPSSRYVLTLDDYADLASTLYVATYAICGLPPPPKSCPAHCLLCPVPPACEICDISFYFDQTTQSCQVCDEQADLVFIFDSSGSINDKSPGNYQRIKNFTVDIVNSLNIAPDQVRVGLEWFSSDSHVGFYLNQFMERTSLVDAINSVPYGGGETNTQAALNQTRTLIFQPENGDRVSVRNIVILITDGESNVFHNETQHQAELLREAATVYVVGITGQIDFSELAGISTPPASQHCWQTPSESTLTDLLIELVNYICTTTPIDVNIPISDSCNVDIGY